MERLDPPLAGFFGKRLAGPCGIDVRAHADVSDSALLGKHTGTRSPQLASPGTSLTHWL